MNDKQQTPTRLETLPVELIDHITSFLPNRDIKSLRLTCSWVRNCVVLRLKRVFISANPVNLQVVLEIAKHKYFRKGVTEIIWDETFFEWRKTASPHGPWDDDSDWDKDSNCPKWYIQRGHDDIRDFGRSKGNDVANRPNLVPRMRGLTDPMTPEESYAYYWELVTQERLMLNSAADYKVFKHAIKKFPSLRRITISTKTHGMLGMPGYETPLIRSFPSGFIYPLPCPGAFPAPYHTSIGVGRDGRGGPTNKFHRRRGFYHALKGLTRHGKHGISEFVVEDEALFALQYSRMMMNHRDPAFDHLRSLIQRPGLQRLDLSCKQYKGIREALEKVDGLRSLCVYGRNKAFNRIFRQGSQYQQYLLEEGSLALPECLVHRLEKLVLDQVSVCKTGLVTLLNSLISLRSLELRFVGFNDLMRVGTLTLPYQTINPREFLFDLRDKTDWRHRSLGPTVIILVFDRRWHNSMSLKLDAEVNEFLYSHGEIPFLPSDPKDFSGKHTQENDRSKPIAELCLGKGIILDELDPAYERPNVNEMTLKRLGIVSTEDSSEYNSWTDGHWGTKTRPPRQPEWKCFKKIWTK